MQQKLSQLWHGTDREHPPQRVVGQVEVAQLFAAGQYCGLRRVQHDPVAAEVQALQATHVLQVHRQPRQRIACQLHDTQVFEGLKEAVGNRADIHLSQ